MSTFKVLASGLYSGKMKDIDLPTERVNYRKLSVDEIKKFIHEEFGKAKEVSKVKAQERNWGDAEIAKEVEWVKTLDLKEFFERE